MNDLYTIKKELGNYFGADHECYFGGYVGKQRNAVFWVDSLFEAKPFTKENGEVMMKVLKSRDYSDGNSQFLLLDFNDIKITDITEENDMNKLYRIRENAIENFGAEGVRWLQNAPTVAIAPVWSHDHSMSAMYNMVEGNKMIEMLKDKRFIDYYATYALVLVDNTNINIQIEKTAVEPISHTLKTPNNLFDDAEAAFDRAFEVL